MGNIYISATEYINKHPYEVMIQAHLTVKFGPPDPIYNSRGRRTGMSAPIYEPFDSNVPQKSRISIAKMIELFTSKSSFTVIHDKDVVDILHQIDAYVAEVYQMKFTDLAVEKYLEKVMPFRDRIYFLFRRILNIHPQWKDSYQNDTGVFGIMAELYRSIGMRIDLPESLMEELRICPTIREYEKRKVQEAMTRPIGHGAGLYDV